MTAYESVTDILTTTFGVSPGQISASTTFEELELDSLDLIEFTDAVSDRLSIRIDDDDLTDVRTIGQAVEMVETKTAAARA